MDSEKGFGLVFLISILALQNKDTHIKSHQQNRTLKKVTNHSQLHYFSY